MGSDEQQRASRKRITPRHTIETICTFHCYQSTTSLPPAKCYIILCPESQLLLEEKSGQVWLIASNKQNFYMIKNLRSTFLSPSSFPWIPSYFIFSFITKEEHHDLFKLSEAHKLLFHCDSSQPKAPLGIVSPENSHSASLRTSFGLGFSTGQKPNCGAPVSPMFALKDSGLAFLEYALSQVLRPCEGKS